MTETPLTLRQGGASVYHKRKPVSRSSFICCWYRVNLALVLKEVIPKLALSPEARGIWREVFQLTCHALCARQSPFRDPKIVENSTALAHQPNLFFTVAGAQQAVFSGQPLISSIGLHGPPPRVPDGYRAVDRNGAADDLLRPLKPAYEAIRVIAVLLWIVAALIVGSVIYLSALERTRDFAVFKALGASTRAVLGGLALQAILVAVIAAALGALLSLALAPLFTMRVAVPPSAYLLLPVIAVVTGVLASAAGLRRSVTVDPALAFGGP